MTDLGKSYGARSVSLRARVVKSTTSRKGGAHVRLTLDVPLVTTGGPGRGEVTLPLEPGLEKMFVPGEDVYLEVRRPDR
ncbi:MAG: hypothetical protein FJX76_15075 [Armatimonadetes bacterium]|nr:hypothetical protein [Armatimonadota bacterium]